jgi:hypothetical protein
VLFFYSGFPIFSFQFKRRVSYLKGGSIDIHEWIASDGSELVPNTDVNNLAILKIVLLYFPNFNSPSLWYRILVLQLAVLAHSPDPDNSVAPRTCSVSGEYFGCMTLHPLPHFYFLFIFFAAKIRHSEDLSDLRVSDSRSVNCTFRFSAF